MFGPQMVAPALPAPTTLVHLTSMDGGNAIELQEQSLPCTSTQINANVLRSNVFFICVYLRTK